MKIGYQPIKKGFQRGRIRVYDNFSRDDGPLNKTETSQAWIITAGTFGVMLNTAGPQTLNASSMAEVVIESGLSDCIITVTFVVVDKIASGATRFSFRHVDNTNEFTFNANDGNYTLAKRVSDVVTVLGSYTYTPTNGDIINIVLRGSLIQIYLNGNSSPIISVTETFNQTATRHGLRVFTGVSTRWDNFKVEALI
jgi:hypothetical protein